jgi:hypothetical protein
MGDDLTGDLRDSLAVIHSSVALLRRRLDSDEFTRVHIERILVHLDKISVTLADLERSRDPLR